MIEAYQISLICLAVHALFWEGMLLFHFGKVIGILIWVPVFAITYILLRPFKGANFIGELSHKIECKLIKPLYDCLICMSSFWTLLIGILYFNMSFDKHLIAVMLMVCGINVIFDSVIYYLRNGNQQL